MDDFAGGRWEIIDDAAEFYEEEEAERLRINIVADASGESWEQEEEDLLAGRGDDDGDHCPSPRSRSHPSLHQEWHG